MQQHMSDLDFLTRMDFRPEFLTNLNHDDPIFSVAVDYTLVGKGGFGHVFTHNPSESIKYFWKSLEDYVRGELDWSLNYANERLSDLRSGEKMIFSYSQEEYDSTLKEINTSIKTIESIPAWWDSIKFDDVGYFNFEHIDKFNSLNVSKLRISDIKNLHSLIEGFENDVAISSKYDFYRSFISQAVEFIVGNLDSPYIELDVPSVDVANSKKNSIENMFETYSNIPVGSLIKVDHPYIPFVFARKTSSLIVPSYAHYSSFWDDSFALEADTVLLGYDGRVEDKSVMQVELRDVFPLNPTIELIPADSEKKIVDDAMRSLNTANIYVAKDILVGSSGFKSWDEGVNSIYDGLKIKRD